MIVSLERDQHNWFLREHSEGKGHWLSPGALRYLREHTDYEPEVMGRNMGRNMARVSFYTVERLWATGHLRELKDRPWPIGSFDEDFHN
jgi:hypothetical protein